ncbi:glycosyltransferase family 39 protein [Hymenobacter sp. BT728]|nr:glycosyltransferase family 39 protein [Hymenobacter pini]
MLILATFQDKRWKPLEVFDNDQGGYYVYLPSIFLYQDAGRADSLQNIQQTYRPGPRPYMGLLKLPNDKIISKYPMGVALAELPWFAGAHTWARLRGLPADGFSRPYQQAIMLAGLFHGLLGLWLLRRLLRRYFPQQDDVVAWAVAMVGLGTNWFMYASYEGAMAHGLLFLWHLSIVWATASLYETRRTEWAAVLGLMLGLAILTRPTAALYALVPVGWGLATQGGPQGWLRWLLSRPGQIALAVAMAVAVVVWQPIFWHAVSGHWFVDTYQGEGFDFAHPHILDGLFSFKKGWLLYTPLAGVALLGLGFLPERLRGVRGALLLTLPVVVYVTFSWREWWYGGSFGARPLISVYPMLALCMAALVAASNRWALTGRVALRTILALGIVLNLWQTYQYAAGVIHWDSMTADRYRRGFFIGSLKKLPADLRTP